MMKLRLVQKGLLKNLINKNLPCYYNSNSNNNNSGKFSFKQNYNPLNDVNQKLNKQNENKPQQNQQQSQVKLDPAQQKEQLQSSLKKILNKYGIQNSHLKDEKKVDFSSVDFSQMQYQQSNDLRQQIKSKFENNNQSNSKINSLLGSKLKKIEQPKPQSITDYYQTNEYQYFQKFQNHIKHVQDLNEQKLLEQQYKKSAFQHPVVNENKYKEIKAFEFQEQMKLIDNLDRSKGFSSVSFVNEKIQMWRDVMQMEESFNLAELYKFKVSDYPGSSKGPYPEDDPDYFCEWFLKYAPQSLIDYLNIALEEEPNYFQQNMQEIEDDYLETADMVQKPDYVMETDAILQFDTNTALLDSQHFYDPQNADADQEAIECEEDIVMKNYVEKDRVDVFPANFPREYQRAMDSFQDWAVFRLYPMLKTLNTEIPRIIELYSKQENKRDTDVVAPSLLRYYNLLPQFARDHIIVKNTVRCLEYHHHDMTVQEKELALNYACQFILPMDDLTYDVMREGIQRKYVPTSYEESQLMKEDEDVKLENKNYDDKVKQEATSMVSYEEWPQPDQTQYEDTIEQLGETLPLEFYDNADGFWDDYIKQKESRYDQYPLITSRPYFKH